MGSLALVLTILLATPAFPEGEAPLPALETDALGLAGDDDPLALPIGAESALDLPETSGGAQVDAGPYFARGVLAEAKAAFDARRFKETRELLAAWDEPPARYLAALAALRSGQWIEAASEL